jgi:hypothetical protein
MPNSHNGAGETKKQVEAIQAINKKRMAEKVENQKDEGTVSQDDIDSLMESVSPSDSTPHENHDEKEEAMSSDDIEKLLLNASEESVAPDVVSEDVLPKDDLSNDPEPREDDGITLEDVDRIMDIVLETDIDIEINDVESKTEDSSPEEDDSGIDESDSNSNDETDNPANSTTDPSGSEGTETISQDNIDNLINGAAQLETVSQDEKSQEETPEKDETTSGSNEIEEDAAVISQDDIDSLLNGEVKEDAPENNAPDVVSQGDIDNLLEDIITDNQGDEPEIISQDDIDNLLNDTPAEDSSENSETGAVSQDDIDDLLQGIETEDKDNKETAESQEEEPELVSQDDIDNLFQDAGGDTDPNEEEKKERSHLLDQGELDQLIKAFEEKGTQKTSDEKPDTDSGEKETEDVDDDTVLVSQDEINRLIGDIQDVPDQEEDNQEEPLESADSDDGDVISQDDIDQLLKIPEEETDDELDEIPDVDDSDKVILEAEKENDTVSEAETSSEIKWYKNRYVFAGAASFLIITCTSLFFYIFLAPETSEETKTITPLASLDPNVQQSVEAPVSDTDNLVNLKDFIVMAPLDREDITLITTHVSITLKDEVSADLIRKNKAFFRGVVYNTVRKSLVLEDRKKTVNALILTSGIKVALNKALPEASVQKIVLNDLNLI